MRYDEKSNVSDLAWIAVFFFISVGSLFYAAIPPQINPVSIADIVLILSSTLSVIYIRKKIMWWAYLATIWFILSSSIGMVRGIDASIVTGISLGLKWIGTLTLYLFLSRSAGATSTAVKTLSLVQVLILVSLITGVRPFPDGYYRGFNGIFQASADGGFYLLCALGFFLVLYKQDPSKFNGFNVLISYLSLLMVDSRYGVLLGLLVFIYYFLRNSNGRLVAFAFFAMIFLGYYLEVLPLPSKIQVLLAEINNPLGLISGDISILIRLNNFADAFEFTSFFGYFVGNGAKFFQLNSFDFFEDNYSLDNSYIYILLSFGVLGLVFFSKIFLSRCGLNILERGPLAFLVLSYALMQDAFSNSFSLISLSLFLSVLTSIVKINSNSFVIGEEGRPRVLRQAFIRV